MNKKYQVRQVVAELVICAQDGDLDGVKEAIREAEEEGLLGAVVDVANDVYRLLNTTEESW